MASAGTRATSSVKLGESSGQITYQGDTRKFGGGGNFVLIGNICNDDINFFFPFGPRTNSDYTHNRWQKYEPTWVVGWVMTGQAYMAVKKTDL